MNGSCIETEIATKGSGLSGRLSRNRSQSLMLFKNRGLLQGEKKSWSARRCRQGERGLSQWNVSQTHQIQRDFLTGEFSRACR
jgi:hypothetical protein